MIRIGLLSDTHLNRCSSSTFKNIQQAFGKVDLILHAGDITHESVLDCCRILAPVHAVKGNMDIQGEVSQLPTKKILELESCKIGLIHGWGAPIGLKRRVFEAFEKENITVIVYGHSHHPAIDDRQGCLMVNPGSPFDKRFAPYHSVAVLTLDSGKAAAEIIRL